MKVYELTKIGTFHLNHNEDALTVNQIEDNIILIAVMDGCSMGTESHFASTLMAKVLRKISKELYFRAFVERTIKSLDGYLNEILESLFRELNEIKNRLLLEREEILSTLILGVLDQQKKEAEIITVGDGLICQNGNYVEYECDDKPDYLGYHLNEDFERWIQSQKQRLSLTAVTDLSFSTDGIFTFKRFNLNSYLNIKENDLVDFMLIDTQWQNQANMLDKKLLEIENKFGLKPSDDLSVVRVIL